MEHADNLDFWRKSRPAAGDHRSRNLAGMLPMEFREKLLDIELFAKASVEFVDADLKLRTEVRQDLHVCKQVAADPLLIRLWQFRRLRYGEFQRTCHDAILAGPTESRHGGQFRCREPVDWTGSQWFTG